MPALPIPRLHSLRKVGASVKWWRRLRARRLVLSCARSVAVSYTPELALKVDPDDLHHLINAVRALYEAEGEPGAVDR